LASAGIATAAVALAAKDTLSNFFGGVSIFMDRPYRLGDYIILGSGERGEVVDIGVRSTRILTRDDVLVTIPNSVMANAKIINETQPAPMYRVRTKVGVSYDSDLDLVEQTLLKSLEGIHQVLDQPTPRVRFRAFGDSALDFELLSWVADPRERGLVQHQINKNIFNNFRQAGIEIPFPQRVVHLPAGSPGTTPNEEDKN
jgi:small-conductance mechanosensitive channel